MKELPRKGLLKITHIINAAFRLQYVPLQIAEVIMIPKLGKPSDDKTSYRSISLLPINSRIFERLLLKRLKPIFEEKNLIPNHQFDFRDKHSTIDQVRRISNVFEKVLEEKRICSTLFLDIAQAFDKVWHRGLEHKMQKYLPKQLSQLLKSYISNRHFRVKYDDSYSEF